MERPHYEALLRELWRDKSMVFVMGPRQAGKTTFAKNVAARAESSLYVNWDSLTDKKKLLSDPLFFEQVVRPSTSATPLVIWDEIHKYRHWKNYLKGICDTHVPEFRFLVLGSGRLDVYKKGGDSLAGRYLQLHLWPLSFAELVGVRPTSKGQLARFLHNPLEVHEPSPGDQCVWTNLFELTGFPEPFLSGRKASYRRWSQNYRERLVREDIRDSSKVQDIDSLAAVYALLPTRVGSPLSLDSVARDVHVSFNSVKRWVDLFESFYLSFRIAPWEARVSRAIRKEKKLYLFDYGVIDEPSARFENMVAFELFKAVSSWNDWGAGHFSLHYVRNKEKQELDFLIVEGRKPRLVVECKLTDSGVSSSFSKFQAALDVPGVQLVHDGDRVKKVSNGAHKVLIAPAWRWLSTLPLSDE